MVSIGTAVEQSGSFLFSSNRSFKMCFVINFMQPEGKGEAANEDAAPWRYQRRQCRSQSRRGRDSWTSRCLVCRGRHWHHWRCTSCGWCWTSTAPEPPPETITITNQDLADVADNEDAMRDDDQVLEEQIRTTRRRKYGRSCRRWLRLE